MTCVLRWKLCLIKWEKKKIENSKDCPSSPRYPNASRRTTWENGIAIERLCFTFTPNGKREFVPRDQDSHLLVIYCSLSLHTNLLFYTIFFLRGGAIQRGDGRRKSLGGGGYKVVIDCIASFLNNMGISQTFKFQKWFFSKRVLHFKIF